MTLLDGADSLFIGGGATTLHFARTLKSINRRLTVLTATFSIATELSTNPLIEVMALPGIVEPKEGLVCGPETLRAIAQYRPPIAVMGASAVDATGVSEALLSAAQVYAAMVDSAGHTIVLADQSKFGNRALQLILVWGPDTTIVTDERPDAAMCEVIESAGASLHITPRPDDPRGGPG